MLMLEQKPESGSPPNVTETFLSRFKQATWKHYGRQSLSEVTSPDTDLMTDINLCKTEGAEVVVCSSDCWFYGLPEEFLNKLANKRPHLFYSLRKKKNLHGTQLHT